MPCSQRSRLLRTAVALTALGAIAAGTAAAGAATPGTPAGRTAPARAAVFPGGPLPGVLDSWERPRWAEVPYADDLLALPARLDRDGVAIVVGYDRAPVTVTLYHDYRCPTSDRFERHQGATLARLARRGAVRIRYVFESSLDARLPGSGAHRAANAARAALARGAFPLYNALLWANQPPEREDGWTIDRLLDLAGEVPQLRDRRFDEAVRGQRYARWVTASQRAYNRYGKRFHFGTPGIEVNGRPVDVDAHPELMNDPQALRTYLEHASRKGRR